MRALDATPVLFSHLKYGQPLAIDASSIPCWTGIVPDAEPHVLDFHEFLVVSQGRADVVIGDRHVRVAGPAVLFTPPSVVRRVEVIEPLRLQLVVFSGRALSRAASAPAPGAMTAGSWRVPDRSLAVLNGIAGTMASELTAPQPDSETMLDGLLAQFLVTLNRSAGGRVSTPPALAVRFERLLDRRFREQHDVSSYASALGVTPDHLSSVVRAHYRVPAKAMIDRRLFTEAERLLASTPLSIAEIGWSLGFDEPSHFTRFFTRACGVAPRRFRSAH
jgi:AraC family transcriptional activator of pobA